MVELLDDEEMDTAVQKQAEQYELVKKDLKTKLKYAKFLNDYFYMKIYKIIRWCYRKCYQKYYKRSTNVE